MKNSITLSKRLSAVCGYINNCSGVIDVGTDHGYIPVYLALNNKAERIVASDINKGPLLNAQKSAEEYGVSDKIEFVLTNGLKGTDHTGIDTVIIAGMGGETIIGILSEAKWTKDVHLILQPQSKLPEFFTWLTENGYIIKNSSLVKEDGKLYTVFSVHGGAGSNDNIAGYVHISLFDNKDPLLSEYLNSLINKHIYIRDNLEKSENGLNLDLMKEITKIIYDLSEVKNEVEKWQK